MSIDPDYWRKVRAGIFAGESGGDYNALYGYSNRPGGRFENVNLSDMTVNDAIEFSDPSGEYGQWVKDKIGRVATPMGAYQIVGTTLRSAKEGLGLSGDEPMTPETQERLGQWIYQNQGTDAWVGYQGLMDDNGDPVLAFNEEQRTRQRGSNTGQEPELSFGKEIPSVRGNIDQLPFNMGSPAGNDPIAAAQQSVEKEHNDAVERVRMGMPRARANRVQSAVERSPLESAAAEGVSGTGFKLKGSDPVPFNPDTTRALSFADLSRVDTSLLGVAFPDETAAVADGFAMARKSLLDNGVPYNISDIEEPKTLEEAINVVRKPPGGVDPRNPRGRFNVEEFKKNERQRRYAADVLELVSVGLGQMAGGQPVNLGPTLQVQRERAQQFGGGLTGSPGTVGGSYGDLLIPGNEEALVGFFKDNGVEHLIPLVGLGPKGKQDALEAAVNYITATPENVINEQTRARVAAWYGENRNDPAAAEAIMADPEAYEFARSEYYKATLGTEENDPTKVWTPQMNADLATQADAVGLPGTARMLRELNTKAAYDQALPEVVKAAEGAQQANDISEMEPEQRVQFAIQNGVPIEAAENLSGDPSLLSAEITRVADERIAREKSVRALNAELKNVSPLLGEPSYDPEGPLASAINAAVDNPTQDTIEALRKERRLVQERSGQRVRPSTLMQEALRANIPADDPTLLEAISGKDDAYEAIRRRIAENTSALDAAARNAEQEAQSTPTYSDAEVVGAANELGPQFVDDLALFTDPSQPQETRDRAAQRIMSAYNEQSTEFAKSQGSASGQAAVERALAADADSEFTQKMDRLAPVIASNINQPIEDVMAALFSADNVTDALQAVDATFNLTEQNRTALAAVNDPEVRQFFEERTAAASEKPTLSEGITQKAVEAFTEQTAKMEADYDDRTDLRNANREVINLVTQPGYEPDSGGPLSPFLSQARSIVLQLTGSEDLANSIQEADVDIVTRLVLGYQGEYFGDYRAEGSGQMTDIEGRYFRQAMAGAGDSAIKQALMAQVMLRADARKEVVLQARRDWQEEVLNSDNAEERFRTKDGLEDFIANRLSEENVVSLPVLDFNDIGVVDTIDQYATQGNLDEQTVVSVIMPGDNEPTFMFARDLENMEFQ